ncbi:hypothetical protein [Shewanella algae]|uniref:hypothetical protein n=1 Tax=Shewanella algae TaxID=38313 RepID=UPI0031F5081D
MAIQVILDKIAAMKTSLDGLLGVIDGKLRNKAEKADVYNKAYLDNPANTLGCRAATAAKLATARTFTFDGDATGTGNFDGSQSVIITLSVSALASKADTANTYTKSETDARIQQVIGAAPEALDTLTELAAALGNDPNFASTITVELGKKANAVDVYTKVAADARFLAIGATAVNSSKLGGQLPGYYTAKADHDALVTELGNALDTLAQAFQDGADLINATTIQ